MTDRKQPRRRRALSPGCLITLVAVLVTSGIGGFFLLEPVREAKQLEQVLLDRHAAVPDHVPAADGAVPPERMEAFLNARARILRDSGEIRGALERIRHVQEVESEEEVTTREGLDFLRDTFGFMPKFLRYQNTRNSALLAEEMGLGEYFYIYALAYGSRICPPSPGGDEGDETTECDDVSDRTTRELARVLANQLESLEKEGGDPQLASILRSEIARLEAGHRHLPWQDGLPPAAAASLEPYREELDQLFSAETASLDLQQKNRNPGGIGD